jgi:hypothetical protein
MPYIIIMDSKNNSDFRIKLIKIKRQLFDLGLSKHGMAAQTTLNKNSQNLNKLYIYLNKKNPKITRNNFIYQTKLINKFLNEENKRTDASPPKPYALNTQMNYINPVKQLLQYDEYFKDKDNSKLINEYTDKMIATNVKINYKVDKGIVSEKQKKQQIPYSKLLEYINNIYKFSERDYIILKILLQFPIRGEVGTLVLIDNVKYHQLVNKLKNRNKKKLEKDPDEKLTKNYLVIAKNKMFMSRNDYKTYPIYGNITSVIKNKDLKKEIREYILENDIKVGDYLFYPDEKNLSARFAYVFKKAGSPVSQSVNSIVKIVIEHNIEKLSKSEDIKKYLQYVSKTRGTSIDTLVSHYWVNNSTQ